MLKPIRMWRDKGRRGRIEIARDVLQLAETASQNHDKTALYSLSRIVELVPRHNVKDGAVSIELLEKYLEILLDAEFDHEFYTTNEKNSLSNKIYELLAKEVQDKITVQKYEANTLGQTVRLASAMYAKVQDGKTKGMSVTILFEDEKITYPIDHFANEELSEYFSKNPHITKNNIEYHMPKLLQGYRLVEGSVYMKDVLPRELEYISY